MSVKKDINGENKTFIEKYKEDKKYKAKVQLIGYGIFIVIIIIYLNIYNMTGNHTNTKLTNQITTNDTENKKVEEVGEWIKELDNNYQYDITVSLKEEDSTKEIHYSGSSYKTKMTIIKEENGITTNYFKEDKNYYFKEEDKYTLSDEDTVYSLIKGDYIELANLKNYLESSELDHYTNYSSGKYEYVYNLLVRNIIKTLEKDDSITFNVVIENDTIIIEVDYANLLNNSGEDVDECKVTYKYTDINKVEEIASITVSDGEENE